MRIGILTVLILGWAVKPGLAQPQTEPPPWKIAKKLNLIPTPRQISLGGEQFPIGRFHIVRMAGEQLAMTAAKEINRRIKYLGGKKLSVSTYLGRGPAIVLATASSKLGKKFADIMNVSTKSPGEQGYAIAHIQYQGQSLIVGLGSDKHGMLYAAMTLRQLIQRKDSGIVLLEASVRDWPAYKRRSFGKIQIFNDPNAKEYIRYLARLKINYINIRAAEGYKKRVKRERRQSKKFES